MPGASTAPRQPIRRSPRRRGESKSRSSVSCQRPTAGLSFLQVSPALENLERILVIRDARSLRPAQPEHHDVVGQALPRPVVRFLPTVGDRKILAFLLAHPLRLVQRRAAVVTETGQIQTSIVVAHGALFATAAIFSGLACKIQAYRSRGNRSRPTKVGQGERANAEASPATTREGSMP